MCFFSVVTLRMMPCHFPDSKSSIFGLKNEVLFVFEFLWDGGENSPNIYLKTCCMISIAHHRSYGIIQFFKARLHRKILNLKLLL